jgi:hypothetical protein
MLRSGLRTALVVVLAACSGNSSRHQQDAAIVIDARSPDAPTSVSPPLPAYEITAGAKTLTGASHKADVQIGHAMSQAPVTGNGRSAQGNSAVKP